MCNLLDRLYIKRFANISTTKDCCTDKHIACIFTGSFKGM